MQTYQVKVHANGDKYWCQNGQFHRLDGPAIEFTSGAKHWYQNDKLHRLDGPAIECASGHKYWYQNGRLHRLNGPPLSSPVALSNGAKTINFTVSMALPLSTLMALSTGTSKASPLPKPSS